MYDDQSITPPQLPTEPDAAETNKPDAAETNEPDAAETNEPDAAETNEPDAAETNEPDAAETNEPDAAETNETEPFNSSSPAISVIIPLYNAENYLSECIDSILAQTFQDFEVIIVDDCSTDSSCEIVESYMPKFDGRLKLYHTPKNTGSGVIARNIGLSYASGEYVYNMDNDDLITETALEEMYTLAKEYDADVVYCEKFYEMQSDGSIKVQAYQKGSLVQEPILEPEDLAERIQRFLDDRYHSTPWLKFIQRKLLIEHNLFFPDLKISDDNIWTQGLIFYAKKILRVPNIIYTWCFNKGSISRIEKTPQVTINFYMDPVLRGLKTLDELMNGHEFFKENLSYRYALLKKFVDTRFKWTLASSAKITEEEIYETLITEFGKSLGEYDVLISCLCTHIFEQHKKMLVDWLRLRQVEHMQENKKLLAEKDAEIRRLKEALAFQTSLLPQASYAISVIIPLYNTAEYVGQCLESLLIQTFQDFEVIVVDDCSTDKSVEVVERYARKFNGRLTLTKTEKNSGGGGYVPRNIGFKLAKGKYVYFMDADDFLLGSALETFYTTAEEHEVDIIYTAVTYTMQKPNEVNVWRDKKGLPAKVLNDDELKDFLHGLAFERVFTFPWIYFVRRKFLLQNSITFPEILKAGDYLWAINICFQAKKIFCLTKPLYFHNEYNINSVSRIGSDNIASSTWILAFADFIKALKERSGKIKFLTDNPNYVYGIANRYLKIVLESISKSNKFFSNQELYEKLYYDFANNLSDSMVPFFFSTINVQQKELKEAQDTISKFKPYFTARIHIRLLTAKGDFKITSVSDEKASVTKPGGFQIGGVGYQLQSHAGKLSFTAKALAAGRVQFFLRGMDVREPKDPTKRIPYWIDYTKLIVNDKTILDKLIPTWHEQPYRYDVDVKANTELKIHIEWSPHKSEFIEPQIVIPPPKPKAITPPPPKFETARVDIKLLSVEGDFQILSVSDDKAKVTKPAGLQNNGVGYVLTSATGNLTFVAKATANGQINLKLRGIDKRNPKDKTKRIPKWVDYTKLIINDKTIFDTLTPTWHDKPYFYKANIKKDEEIKIQLEWQPCKKDT